MQIIINKKNIIISAQDWGCLVVHVTLGAGLAPPPPNTTCYCPPPPPATWQQRLRDRAAQRADCQPGIWSVWVQIPVHGESSQVSLNWIRFLDRKRESHNLTYFSRNLPALVALCVQYLAIFCVFKGTVSRNFLPSYISSSVFMSVCIYCSFKFTVLLKI